MMGTGNPLIRFTGSTHALNLSVPCFPCGNGGPRHTGADGEFNPAMTIYEAVPVYRTMPT